MAGLRDLHAAHLERMAYHLNGAFSLLLRELGYDVVWHRAGVENRADPGYPGPDRANHLALTVHGLPSEDCPSGVWFVDVGLGDALYEPLPLHEGEYVQGPFRYRLRASEIEPGGWRFDHDPRGIFAGADVRAARATVEDFVERHAFLSTSPQSGFVTTCSVQRRDGRGVDKLTGCVLHRIDGSPRTPRTIETASEWFEVLDEVFGLPLRDVNAAERDALWTRVRSAHTQWLSQRASGLVTSP